MKRTLTTLGAILITAFAGTAIYSQQPRTSADSVSSSQTTQPVVITAQRTDALDDVCEQRLAKTLDALEKTQALVKALEAQIATLNRLNQVNAELLTAKDGIINDQAKLIEIYKKQTGRKISFLFGLVKVRY